METVPQKYKTTDDKEFENEKEAVKHEELITAQSEFEDALKRYSHALFESQETADGHPFKFTSSHDYYTLVVTGFQMPRLQCIRFYFYNCTLDDNDAAYVTQRTDHDGNCVYQTYRISELYHDKVNAEAILLEAQEKYVSDVSKDVKNLAAKLRARG